MEASQRYDQDQLMSIFFFFYGFWNHVRMILVVHIVHLCCNISKHIWILWWFHHFYFNISQTLLDQPGEKLQGGCLLFCMFIVSEKQLSKVYVIHVKVFIFFAHVCKQYSSLNCKLEHSWWLVSGVYITMVTLDISSTETISPNL